MSGNVMHPQMKHYSSDHRRSLTKGFFLAAEQTKKVRIMRDDESVQNAGRRSVGHARYLHDEWDAGGYMHGDKHWANHQT
jgi:hypothetical protein